VAAAIMQDTSDLLTPSLLYEWDPVTTRFGIFKMYWLTGAAFVEHTRVPTHNGSADLLIWASLYSFSGGCESAGGSGDIPVVTCSGTRRPASNVTVMQYDQSADDFVVRQHLPCTGCSHVLAFELPCQDSAEAEASACRRHYLALSSRQVTLPGSSVLSTQAYLEQFDGDTSLWVWLDQGKYVEVPNAFGGGGSIPSRHTADACIDSDLYVDLRLPYGPCDSYMPGAFNDGFCLIDQVCDTCQASCALECRADGAACVMTEAAQLALYAKRLQGLWPSMEEVPGLRGATSMLHFEHEHEHYLAIAQGIPSPRVLAAFCNPHSSLCAPMQSQGWSRAMPVQPGPRVNRTAARREQLYVASTSAETAYIHLAGVCDLLDSGQECLEQAVTQPQSTILQWSGADPLAPAAPGSTALFDKLLAKRPRRPLEGLELLHANALRIAAGSVNAWRLVSVSDASGRRSVALLLASSVTEGLVSYPWHFERTSGLTGVDALLAYPVDSFLPGGYEAPSPAPRLEQSAGHQVYVASATERRIGSYVALPPHHAAWAAASNFPARGHIGHRTARGGPVYDSLGNLVTRVPQVFSTLFGKGVLEGTKSMQRDKGDTSKLRVERALPTADLVCGSATPGAPDEWRALPLYAYDSAAGEMQTHLFEWHQTDYMTGCHELHVNVSADSDAEVAAMDHLFQKTPSVQTWGDIIVESRPGTSGTALLRASIYSHRTPARLPAHVRQQEVEGGDHRLFWASVARVNLQPAMHVVSNISVTVEGDATGSAAGTGTLAATFTCGYNLSAGSEAEDTLQHLTVSVLRVSNPYLFTQTPVVAVEPNPAGPGWLARMSLVTAPVCFPSNQYIYGCFPSRWHVPLLPRSSCSLPTAPTLPRAIFRTLLLLRLSQPRCTKATKQLTQADQACCLLPLLVASRESLGSPPSS